MKETNKNEKGNIILALALMKYLHNNKKLPDHVYQNIKKEYEQKIKKS